MSYPYLTNILVSKQKISFQNCAKFFINRQLGYRKNNHLTELSSLSSRMFTLFPWSVKVNKNLCNETTKSIDFNRNFSTSSVARAESSTPNKNKERRKNYIFAICCLTYAFTAFYLHNVLNRKEDNVYIEPEESKA